MRYLAYLQFPLSHFPKTQILVEVTFVLKCDVWQLTTVISILFYEYNEYNFMEVLRKIYPQQLKDAALQPGNNDDYFGKFGVSKYKGHKQINFNEKNSLKVTFF